MFVLGTFGHIKWHDMTWHVHLKEYCIVTDAMTYVCRHNTLWHRCRRCGFHSQGGSRCTLGVCGASILPSMVPDVLPFFFLPCLGRIYSLKWEKIERVKSRGHTIVTSRELTWCYACSWDVRGDLTLNCMAQVHTSVTLLTSRDLTWRSGRLTWQHASHISVVAHISWDVSYVRRALQTLLPVVSRNGGNAYWKSAPTDLFIWHKVARL